ncbi:MAG: DNA repair protein RecO [Acidimicrobiales bacterium]
MAIYRAEGVVLRTIKLGEADKILTICTRERGKVRAVAKGVRKTQSRFGGRLEPCNHVSLQLYEGRELDTITQAETVTTFAAVRGDLDRLGEAVTLLEAVDQLSQPNQADPRLLDMLLGALAALNEQDSKLLVPAFLLKLLAHDGVRPELDACTVCSREDIDALTRFDAGLGGMVCESCHRGHRISPEAHTILRGILGGQLGAILALPDSKHSSEVVELSARMFEYHIERRLRSHGLLDRH